MSAPACDIGKEFAGVGLGHVNMHLRLKGLSGGMDLALLFGSFRAMYELW